MRRLAAILASAGMLGVPFLAPTTAAAIPLDTEDILHIDKAPPSAHSSRPDAITATVARLDVEEVYQFDEASARSGAVLQMHYH